MPVLIADANDDNRDVANSNKPNLINFCIN